MVTCVPGNSSCTASAMTWLASWRRVSSALGRVARQDLELAAVRQRPVDVVELAVQLDQRGALGERGRDGGRHVLARRAVVVLAFASRRGKSGRSCFTGPLARLADSRAALARGRDRVVTRTAAPGMTTAQPASGESAPAPRAVADQGVCGVFRTGRKEPALPPDQRRKRQLVGAERASDAAFVEGHAGYGDLASEGSAITLRLAVDQAAPAGLVRPVVRSVAVRTASVTASNASSVEAWRAG